MGCNCNKTHNISMGCCQPVLGPIENYYTKPQIDRMIDEIESAITSGCCITPEEVDEKIEEAISGITSGVTEEQMDEAIAEAKAEIESEIPTVPTNVSAFNNDAGYLTEHQSLSGYATEQWVEDQGYLTEHQHLKTLNGESLVGDGNIVISGGTDLSNYYTTAQTVNLVESAVTRVEGEIPSLSGYATEQWVLDKHYISGVDLSDYVTYDSIPDPGELATKEWVINNNYATNSKLIQYVTNLQQQIDSLKQQISGCCGDTGETLTRWMVMTGDSNYTCSGTTKMTKEAEEQSTDGGNTWSRTGNYRAGNTVLEENSIACGYGDCQYCCEAKLSGDSTVYTPSTWVKYYNGVLNRSTTNQGFFETNEATITHMTFNECVKKVESNAFYIAGFTAVEYIDIPATVTEIGHSAFNIGTSTHFSTMVVRATTPPALSSYEDELDSHGTEGPTFKSGGRNLKIYVPDQSLDTYKNTPRWSNYRDILYPISQLS